MGISFNNAWENYKTFVTTVLAFPYNVYILGAVCLRGTSDAINLYSNASKDKEGI